MLSLFLIAAAAGPHRNTCAATLSADCNALPLTALGTTLAGAAAGDTIQISGTCQQDVLISTPDVTLTFKSGDSPESDGIQGQIEIAGARQVTLLGLLLGIGSGTFNFASASDQAILYAHDGASMIVQSSVVSNSKLLGILAERSARVSLIDTSVLGNGHSFSSDTTASPNGFGIRATDGSSLDFQTLVAGVAVEFNQGGGVALIRGSTLVAADAQSSTIDSNGGQQILLIGGSSVHATNLSIDGGTCSGTHPATVCGDTVDAFDGSAVRFDATGMLSSNISAVVNQDSILVSGGSTLLMSQTTVTAPAGTAATIQASDNSIIALAGGNMVCSASCDGSTTGTAVVIDHVSSLIDVAPADFGYSSAPDAIFGSAQVQLQSTVDLGLGPISAAPSLTWNTGSGATIAVAQNSSFRLEGGVAITGQLTLSQGSNGFFNATAGGTNVISAGVVCPFTAIPSAHVLAGTASALSPTPALAASFLSASSAAKQCLPF